MGARVGKKTDRDLARLDAIYASLPRIECRGLCAEACGPIMLSPLEADRIRAALHETPRCREWPIELHPDRAVVDKALDRVRCSLLSDRGRCRAYALRPLICRAWGLAKRMSCFAGCVPDRWLTDHEFARLMAEVEAIGGPLVQTTREGLVPYGDSFAALDLASVSEAEAERLAEITRTLRILHRGRILAAVPTPPGEEPQTIDASTLKRRPT